MCGNDVRQLYSLGIVWSAGIIIGHTDSTKLSIFLNSHL